MWEKSRPFGRGQARAWGSGQARGELSSEKAAGPTGKTQPDGRGGGLLQEGVRLSPWGEHHPKCPGDCGRGEKNSPAERGGVGGGPAEPVGETPEVPRRLWPG